MSAGDAMRDDDNRQGLWSAIAYVRTALARLLAARNGEPLPEAAPEPELDSSSTLAALCGTFDLQSFERDVLVACAALELDDEVAKLIGQLSGEARRGFTFGLALDAFANPHWRALTPAGPLRRFGLIEMGTGERLTRAPLSLDERVLHFLAGVSCFDERLLGILELASPIDPDELPSSHRALLDDITAVWESNARPQPVVQLCGRDHGSMFALAAAATGQLGAHLLRLRGSDIPVAAADRERLLRLCEREAGLTISALYVDFDDRDDAETQRAAAAFVEALHAPVFIGIREPLRVPRRPSVQLLVSAPSVSEQLHVWQRALGPIADQLDGDLTRVASQFSLGVAAIQAASARVHDDSGDNVSSALWNACRAQARPRLDELAQRIDPIATWDDLVLPEAQLSVLRELALHGRHRATVYEAWGFAARSARGNGTSALFTGVSGTGKTMAAEVIARELDLDLYRIDLSQVVSKYVGETEKNLRRVFDAAETGGVVLLFDEADALFGKRSEVKDSRDRYANIEVSYLLQRMEQYRGLALLTTNMKEAVDPAFMRRIRFVVQFPFPDEIHRAEIWRRVFPKATPTRGLDAEQLARLHVAGGNIRNIALNGAFLAASESEPIMMKHLLQAARTECMKLGRPPSADEIEGWV
ncbi:MAG TPA: AAA family ATPase [Kofleriaceae bacterium]